MRLQKDFDPIVCVLVPYERIEEATNAHDMSQTTFLLLLPESHSVILRPPCLRLEKESFLSEKK